MKRVNHYALLAPFYDLLSKLFLGNKTATAGAYFLKNGILNRQRILMIGIGTGRCFEELNFSELQFSEKIVGVDFYPQMIKICENRLKKIQSSSFISLKQEDFRNFRPNHRYDMIIANFFVDCLPDGQILEFMTKTRQFLSPNGQLVITDFYLDPKLSSRIQKAKIRLAYIFFKLMTNIPRMSLPKYSNFCDPNQWILVEEVIHDQGFIKSMVLCPKEENRLSNIAVEF